MYGYKTAFWVYIFCLSKLVNEEGGFDAVCRERRWTKISVKMGFAPGKAIGSHLRAHYERILYPYNLFQTGDNLPVRQIAYVFFSQLTAVDRLFFHSWVDVYWKSFIVLLRAIWKLHSLLL